MNTCLASINNASYQILADITVTQNKLLYCQHYGYRPYFKNNNWYTKLDNSLQSNTHNLGFEKIAVILEIMEKYPTTDLIWFTDCDSLITNFNIPIEAVFKKYWQDGCFFMASEDGNGINVGSLIIKCCIASYDYCKFILSQKENYKDKSWNEQQVIIDTHQRYKNGLILIPQKELNAYDYSLYQQHQFSKPLQELQSWSKGDLLIHWPGMNLDQRIILANKYIQEVIM